MARHAGQGLAIGIEHRAHPVEGMARIQHQDHLLAEVGEGGAVLPLDARRIDAPLPLVRIAQLASGSSGSLLFHRGVDLVERHPLGALTVRPSGPDHEADVAALAAAELESDHGIAQHRLAIGTRMAKGNG